VGDNEQGRESMEIKEDKQMLLCGRAEIKGKRFQLRPNNILRIRWLKRIRRTDSSPDLTSPRAKKMVVA
jgi:hypothetical protein